MRFVENKCKKGTNRDDEPVEKTNKYLIENAKENRLSNHLWMVCRRRRRHTIRIRLDSG